MKIRGWAIEGFGVFRDFSVRDLPDGMVVFLGPNEAGKSTLLSFIQGVLFGFPDGRSSLPRYKPLRGGRYGGKVYLEGPEGEITVERTGESRRRPPRVLLPGGKEGTEDDLIRLLGGADAKLFRSVFAFGLEELRTLKTLENEGVSERIFSAGIAGAGRSAQGVSRKLSERRTELWRPRSRKRSAVADLLQRIEEADKRLKAAREAARGYPALVEAEERKRKEAEELYGEVKRLRRRRDRAKRLLDLWPLWSEILNAREELARSEEIDSFPEDPQGRLERILAELKSARDKVTEVRAELEEREKRAQELSARLNPSFPRLRGRIEELNQRLGAYRAVCDRLADLAASVREEEKRVEEKLALLGEGWNEEKAEKADLSLARAEEARAFENELGEARRNVGETQRALEAAKAASGKARREYERLKEELSSHGESELEEIERKEEAIRSLRALLLDLRSRRAELRGSENAVRALLLSGGGVLVLGAAVFLMGWREIGGTALAVSVLLLLFGFVAGRISWRTQDSDSPGDGRGSGSTLSGKRAKVQELASSFARAASVFGEERELSASEIEELAARVAGEREEWNRRESVRSRFEEAERRLEETLGEEKAAAERHERERRSLETVEKRWAQWKEKAGLPPALSPAGALDFLREVRSARESLRLRDEKRREIEAAQEERRSWEKGARELLREAGRKTEGLDGDELLAAFLEVRKESEEDSEIRRSLEKLREEISRLRGVLESAVRREAEGRRELDSLFAEAGCDSESAFRERLEVFRRRRELRRRIEDRERQIEVRLGADLQGGKLKAELAAGKVEAWREEVSETETLLGELEKKRDDLLLELHEARKAREELEKSADTVTIETEKQGLCEALRLVLRKWRILSLAEGLVEETLERYVRTRQPAVLADASGFFSAVTGGRYERIVQRRGKELEVIDGGGGVKKPEELSRGTAEQLYLCLRLGLAREFARRKCALPLVLDDVLVNFDPARARALAELLSEFSLNGQVFLFTCHPATAELVLEAAAKAAVWELDSWEGVLEKATREKRPEISSP